MWCDVLNRAQIDLNVVRISAGKYLFGSRNIICKIVNGKLLVRVGGGYMSADEFVDQYGQIEMLKAMKEAGDPNFEEARKTLAHTGNQARSGSNPRTSVMAPNVAGLAEMKEKMKNDILNAKAYTETARVGNSGSQAAITGSADRLSSPKGSASGKRLKSPK